MSAYPAEVTGLGAARLCPAVRPYLLASHLSVEVGHARVLEQLGLRLGEGSGAALRILHDMATFAGAGGTDLPP